MVDRFSPGRLGDWVIFCDICGQKCYASEATKLTTYTGRGGLIVCPHDVDVIDYGIVPYKTPTERNIPWTRINHTDVSISAPVSDLEQDTVENISSYINLATENDEIIVVDDDNWIALQQDR